MILNVKKSGPGLICISQTAGIGIMTSILERCFVHGHEFAGN